MKISFYTNKPNLDTTRGYGNAGYQIIKSLQRLGHQVPFDDPTAPVQICFCPPHEYKFHEGQYKIGYSPWESTELPAGWLEIMNDCDEVWATSEWVANVYKDAGVTKPIFVYHHGLDPFWAPYKRTPGDKLKFLHVGEPALRKGGQMTLDAYRAVFADSENVSLKCKTYHQHYLRTWHKGKVVEPDTIFDNVNIINKSVSEYELRQLFYDHDVLVYPSYGEGFGLIPLQALGTGMPVVSTYDWAPYKGWINIPVLSRKDRSIWSLHPGNVFYPDYESLKSSLKTAERQAPGLISVAYAFANDVHDYFDWDQLTEKAFDHVVRKFT